MVYFSIDGVCSQRHVSDVCETMDQAVDKNGNNENSLSQQRVDESGESNGTNDQRQDTPVSSSLNTSISNIPKAIPTNEADMICTTVENVSHVRFEWTVEDFYPQM